MLSAVFPLKNGQGEVTKSAFFIIIVLPNAKCIVTTILFLINVCICTINVFKFVWCVLRSNFEGECTEVGMYLAMARVAHREGYPEIGLYWEKAAWEEAEHAAKFAELLGEMLTDSTKKNLELRIDAENGATMGKFELAKRAKELNLDAIHDTVHEMARDEARHGKAFEGLYKRYFN